MNANICGTRDKYLLQRLSRVISETHDEKTNICLGIHKYLCFNNRSTVIQYYYNIRFYLYLVIQDCTYLANMAHTTICSIGGAGRLLYCSTITAR